MYKRVYEDDNWVIDVDDDKIRIANFFGYNYMDEIEFTSQMFREGELLDDIKTLQNDVDLRERSRI